VRSSVKRILSGLRFLWMIPLLWQYASPCNN
jgi:hypothetical protein